MNSQTTLNLLVVDDNQLYAERIVALLSHYYDDVNLGFLDDKEELMKMLRQSWDVLIFGKAYDMSFTDVVGIVQEQNIDLPLICLVNMDNNATTGADEDGIPTTIDGRMVKTLIYDNAMQVVIATCLLHDNLKSRREMSGLKSIIAESEQRANILIKNSKSAVAYIDQGIHIFANDPYLKMFGFENMEDIIGVPVIDLIAGGDNVKSFKQFLRRFDKGNRDKVEFKFESRRKDGTTFEAKLQLAAATFDGSPVTQVIIQQNDSGANAAEIAKKLAEVERKDNLTGLLNRRGFEDKFAEIYVQVKSGEANAALIYVRIDDIGKINSNLGIQGVDATIKNIGFALDENFEMGDVCRFSDSSFMILMSDVREAEVKSQAEQVRDKIRNMIVEVGTRSVTTTVTMGGVFMDPASPDPTEIINRAVESASQAFSESDNEGNAVRFYDPGEHADEDDKVLAEYLQTALTKSQLKLLFQPIYDIETDTSDFFEVYLRLPLADGELMAPDKFLPIAKNYNLLDKIDRWVLINACKQLSLSRRKDPNIKVLVQLTSHSLASKQLASVVSQLVKAVGGPAETITLQFSERDVVDHMAVAKRQFDALKRTGCRLCIHDFGATAKTVDVIEYVMPSMVRLARNYVNDLSNPDNLETVKTLVSKANERGIAVLMPYIEDASAMSVSWSVGARYLQGYYLQEPSESMIVVTEGEAGA